MHIVVHDYVAHPFQLQLSRELARRGHTVHHLYSGSFQGPKGVLDGDASCDSLNIEAVFLPSPFKKYSFIRRRFQEVSYGKLVAKRIRELRPDVVISTNTPTEAQAQIEKRSREISAKFIIWVQDIYSLAARRLLRKRVRIVGELVGRYYIKLEQRLLAKSDEIILITEDFLPIFQSWHIADDKMHVIPNWATLAEMPSLPKVNAWSQEYGVADKFCFLYSGTLGLKHNPDLLLQLALHFQDDDDIRIVVISEGLGADWLNDKKRQLGLDNLLLLDFQPYERLAQVLAAGDVLVTILDLDAGVFSVPSKVLTYFCAERPLLLAVPPENLSAKIVTKIEAGLVISPSNVQGFLEAATELFLDAELRQVNGLNARRYAEENFDIRHICDQFERIIVRGTGAAAAGLSVEET